MRSRNPDSHSALLNLWTLRLLQCGLDSGGFPPVKTRGNGRSLTPDEFDEVMAGMSVAPTPPRRRRRASSLGQSIAVEVAGFLEIEFDPDEPGATTRLRRTLARDVARAARALGPRTPLEALSPDTRGSLKAVAELLGLSAEEQLCLAFVTLLGTENVLERASSILGHDLDDHSADRVIAAATGLDVGSVNRAFASSGRIVGCQLIKRDVNGQRLTGKFDWVCRSFPREMRQPGFDPMKAMRDRVVPAPPPKLVWDQFAHLGDMLALARTYGRQALLQRKRGVNFLLHGEPGVGKTEFVRALARELECELYEVSTEDSEGDPIVGTGRLQALRLAQEFTSRRRAMVVFDEVEDAVPRMMLVPMGGPRTPLAKGWINRMLEHNPTFSVWITNAVDALDPAFVRRFDVVIEMKAPPAAVREAQLRALPVAVSEQVIRRMVDCPQVTPGIAARAAAVVESVAAVTPGFDVSRHLEMLANQTLRAQGHGALKPSLGVPQVYDPRFIHADVDPIALIEGLRSSRSGRLCLFGPPGTGKSAFAQHLTRELGLRLLERRASDLLSPYVGVAEKNIAAAFQEAEESGAALLIDEVDSFLLDRSRAHRSWEVTQVNEFLTQLERFSGLFIASTNLIDGFDPAALRRFDLKCKFDYMGEDQASGLLAAHLRAAGVEPAGPAETTHLRVIANLTPGDFGVVARQHRFRPLTTAAAWVSALEAECRLKPGQARSRIGFPGAAS